MTTENMFGGARKCSSLSKRCRGKKTNSKKQVYWKAKKNDPCDGFYFEIGPTGGLASQQKHPLYPGPKSPEFSKQLRLQHQQQVGSTYSSSRFHPSRFLGKGPSKGLKPENTKNTYCGEEPGTEYLNEDVSFQDEYQALLKKSTAAEKKYGKKKKKFKSRRPQKRFKSRRPLRGGVSKKVSKKSKYSCNRCKYQTNSEKYLNNHVRKQH